MSGVVLPPAVVLSQGAGGLGGARALWRRGVTVTAVAWSRNSPIRFTRAAERIRVIPDGTAKEKHRALVEMLLPLGAQRPVLLVDSDALLEFVVACRPALVKAGFRTLFPSGDLIAALDNKELEAATLDRAGVPVPRTSGRLPSRPEELAHSLRLPLILKPRTVEDVAASPAKNFLLSSSDKIGWFYAQFPEMVDRVIAQEFIPGEDDASWVCGCSFNAASKLLACAVKRKLRMYPPHRGGSTLAVSQCNAELVELSEWIAKRLGIVGHCNIEFRRDARDGRYYYIETNLRFPSNVEFDEASGVPTAWYTYLAAAELPTPEPAPQVEGVVYLDLGLDLCSAWHSRTPPWVVARQYAPMLAGRTSGDFFTWDDPAPGLWRLWDLATRAAEFCQPFSKQQA